MSVQGAQRWVVAVAITLMVMVVMLFSTGAPSPAPDLSIEEGFVDTDWRPTEGPPQKLNRNAPPSHASLLRRDDQKLWKQLLEEKCSPLVQWKRSINMQLAPWLDKGFTQESLDLYCHRKSVRLSVVDGRIRFQRWGLPKANVHRALSGLWLMQLASLRAIERGNPWPPLDLVMQPGDGAYSTAPSFQQWENPGPALFNSKCGQDASISFPMTYSDQFGGAKGFMSISKYQEGFEALKAMGSMPWDARVAKLFFSAGAGAVERGMRGNLQHLKSPHAQVQNTSAKLAESGKYRYLVYAYGHCGWSRRIHELAFMGAVVFMEDSMCREFMHHALIEGDHYIGVKEDFSDLDEKLDKAAADDKQSRATAERFSKVAIPMMSLTCTLDYIDQLLREYATLQRFEPVENTTWPLYQMDQDSSQFYVPGTEPHPDMCPPKPKGPVIERSRRC